MSVFLWVTIIIKDKKSNILEGVEGLERTEGEGSDGGKGCEYSINRDKFSKKIKLKKTKTKMLILLHHEY